MNDSVWLVCLSSSFNYYDRFSFDQISVYQCSEIFSIMQIEGWRLVQLEIGESIHVHICVRCIYVCIWLAERVWVWFFFVLFLTNGIRIGMLYMFMFNQEKFA